MSIGAVHYATGKFWASDNTIVMHPKSDSTRLSPRFLYYWLLLNNKVLKDLTSGIKPGIRKSDVMEIKMPLPPIQMQNEIVITLDNMYNDYGVSINLSKISMDLLLSDPKSDSLKTLSDAYKQLTDVKDLITNLGGSITYKVFL